jgi:hypothetical protein
VDEIKLFEDLQPPASPDALRMRAAARARLTAAAAAPPAQHRRTAVAVATVETHLLNVYTKLGVGDRAAAVAEAYNRGLLTRR